MGPRRGVAVVHAGWRGVLAGLPGSAGRALAEACGVEPGEIHAYVGPHIGACCYNVDSERLALFEERFAGVTYPEYGLDLASAVRANLGDAGVPSRSIVGLSRCTSDATEVFFSYRRAQTTGRHGALAAICGAR
jgi:copper oxidase (laccase) domain-containing protein